MTMVVVFAVGCVVSFALGMLQGWVLRRPPPRQPLLRVPRFERASLIVSEGCVLEMGAVEVGTSGTFDVEVIKARPHSRRKAARDS